MNYHFCLITALLLALWVVDISAQTFTDFANYGNAILTHYSGAGAKDDTLKRVLTIIATSGANLQKPYDNWKAAKYSNPDWNVNNLGEVFGVCTDSSKNIYVTATSIYGVSKYGSGGGGGIYKIDSNGNYSVFCKLPNQIDPKYNYAPGLGNICFDKTYNNFFVTNFENGKIYRLNYLGTILDSLDPFQKDDQTRGFAPLTERIWGIGVNKDRIYYGRYCSDMARSGALNQIWSVPFDRQNFDVSKNILELTLKVEGANGTITYNFPASDIEFSRNGRNMLVACKTMSGDMIFGKPTDPTGTNNFSHRSNLYIFQSYSGNTTTWDTINNYSRIPIGDPALNATNCSGGSDFSYFPAIGNQPEASDTYFWSSGEGLHLKSYDKINGLQAVPANKIFDSEKQSVYIDLNESLEDMRKGEMGDIDIFKPTVETCFSYDTTVSVSTTCNQKQQFYITLANCSETDAVIDTITLTNSKVFKIEDAFQSSVRIKKHESLKILATYTPLDSGIQSSDMHISFQNHSEILAMKVVGSNENKFLKSEVKRFDFGNVQLGDSLEISGYIRNYSTQNEQFLRFFSLSPPFEILTDQSLTIPVLANDSIPFRVKFKPTKYGVFSDTIQFIINPCKYVINIFISGYSKLVCAKPLTDSLRFKQIVCMGKDTMKVKIFNCGQDTLKLSAFVSSPDFEILNFDKSTSLGGDTAIITVSFAPKVYGSKTDTLRIKSNTKGNFIFNIPIKGNYIFQQSRFSLSENRLDFGTISFGDSLIKSIIITNHNNYPVTVNYQNNQNNFNFLQASGLVIPQSSSQEIKIKYSNNSCSQDTDFVIVYLSECSDTAYLRMFGAGDLSRNGLLALGTLDNKINIQFGKEITLPIFLKKSHLLNEAQIRNIYFSLRLNSTMFLVNPSLSANKFNLKELNRINDGKTLSISFHAALKANEKFSINDTLGFFSVIPYASEDTTGFIKFENLKTDGCAVTLQPINSAFETHKLNCFKNREVELMILPKINNITPNPANQAITALIEHDIAEELVVKLIDLKGNEAKAKFNIQRIDDKNSILNIIPINVSSGEYTLIIKNKSGEATRRIIFNK